MLSRIARFGLVVVMLGAGVVGLGWEPGDDIPASGNVLERSASFSIGDSFAIWSEGDLVFSATTPPGFPMLNRVTSPSYRGTARTEPLFIYVVTNTAVKITGTVTAYSGGDCPKTLGTQWSSTVDKWIGEAWQPIYFFDWTPAPYTLVVNLSPCGYWGIGYFRLGVKLEVKRSGYDDPAGVYTAILQAVIAALP